jgi:NADH dehydrogenase FAD-containing subunit
VPVVVIVGAGFDGLAAARDLRNAPVRVIPIDRPNHHSFKALLYQVATSVLRNGQIGSPVRGILRKNRNATVILGGVCGVDKEQKCVRVNYADRQNRTCPYDYLMRSTGATHNYFWGTTPEQGGRTEVELSAAGHVAFQDHRKRTQKWFNKSENSREK